MATTLTRTRDASGTLSGFAGLRASLSERFAQYRLYRQTLGELSALSDRDLADLGLHRADIRDIASDAAYRG